MVKHMDFILEENRYTKLKLRFYPRQSTLHLSDDGVKKEFSERTFHDACKIDYSWAILRSDNRYDFVFDEVGKFVENEDRSLKIIDNWTIFREFFKVREDSTLHDIDNLTRTAIITRKADNRMNSSKPGSDWNIRYNKGYSYDEYLREWKANNGENEDGWEDWEKELWGLRSEKEFYEHEDGRRPWLEYMVWKNESNIGFKFRLSVDKAFEFAKFIDEVNRYMLVACRFEMMMQLLRVDAD